MTYRDLDFNGDKPRMYEELGEPMAEIYQDVDVKILGPVNVTHFNKNTKSNVDQTRTQKYFGKRRKNS